MAELAWPVTKCENPKCGFEFNGTKPKPKDRALSEDGMRKPMWSDFCPKCGRGYIVGERVIPEPRVIGQIAPLGKPLPPPTADEIFEVTAEVEKEPEPEPEVVFVDEVKPLPSNLVYGIPETESPLAETFERVNETAEPKADSKPLRGDEYFCTFCERVHRKNTKPGKHHIQYQEVK